jgi:hypothetical protein
MAIAIRISLIWLLIGCLVLPIVLCVGTSEHARKFPRSLTDTLFWMGIIVAWPLALRLICVY